MDSPIIEIGDILVSSEIVTEYFCCDYEKCRGICCIEGESGAPLKEEELDELERDYPIYSQFMSRQGTERVKDTGFFEIDRDGDIVTPLLGNSEECVYTLFEEGNCLCSIERAHCKGLCRFAKPISCRLYPIRVSKLSNGYTALNLHRWDVCKCAFEKGRRDGIPVYRFLKKPLTFEFGEEFYNMLDEAAHLMKEG